MGFGWDRGIPYDQLKSNFITFFNYRLSEFIRSPSKNKGKQIIYIATAILQLNNGMRAGESMLSLRKFIEEGEKEFEIYVFKQKYVKKLKDGRVVEKKPSDFESRVVKIPSLLIVNKYHLDKAINIGFEHPDNYMPISFLDPRVRAKNYKKYDRLANNYESWLQRNFHVNTHTLRYAWQNKVLEYIQNTEIIAKIQGRQNLNVLLDYIRSTKAKEKYEEIFKYLE